MNDDLGSMDEATSAREVRTYHVPVSPGRELLVEGPFPLSDTEWDRLMAVLEAMRPALVDPMADFRYRSVFIADSNLP